MEGLSDRSRDREVGVRSAQDGFLPLASRVVPHCVSLTAMKVPAVHTSVTIPNTTHTAIFMISRIPLSVCLFASGMVCMPNVNAYTAA